MPTMRPRISVTKDPSLAEALERGRTLLATDAPEATLLRDLAVEGVRLLGDELARRDRSLRDLGDHEWLDERLDPVVLGLIEDDLPVEL